MSWSSGTLLVIMAISVIGQDTGTDNNEVYPSYPGQEDPDIAYPPPSQQSGEPHPSDINWNDTVDYLLDLANSKGRDEVPLPNITEQFTRKMGPLTLRGNFTASQGLLKGLSSVRRTGDVTVLKHGTAFTMTCSVGLQDIRLSYEHYRVKIRRGPSISGSIEGEIGTNSVEVSATIDVRDSGCATTLEGVKVKELSGLKIRVQGLGPPLDGLVSMISTWLMEVFKGDLVRNLERGLTRELTRSLAKSRCEKYAGYFIFVEPK